MKAAIILKDAYLKNFNKGEYDLIIGVDSGALHAIKNNIFLDIAIGDFDSVNNNEYELVKNNSKEIIKLNPIKDITDTNAAISKAKGYDIEILGGIKGKRIEHFISNIFDIINHKNVLMKDEYSLIEFIDNNDYKVRSGYKFVSLFPIEESIISLSGFKYNLDNYNLKLYDNLCISNEIINNPKIELKKGKILIIYTIGD